MKSLPRTFWEKYNSMRYLLHHTHIISITYSVFFFCLLNLNIALPRGFIIWNLNLQFNWFVIQTFKTFKIKLKRLKLIFYHFSLEMISRNSRVKLGALDLERILNLRHNFEKKPWEALWLRKHPETKTVE